MTYNETLMNKLIQRMIDMENDRLDFGHAYTEGYCDGLNYVIGHLAQSMAELQKANECDWP